MADSMFGDNGFDIDRLRLVKIGRNDAPTQESLQNLAGAIKIGMRATDAWIMPGINTSGASESNSNMQKKLRLGRTLT